MRGYGNKLLYDRLMIKGLCIVSFFEFLILCSALVTYALFIVSLCVISMFRKEITRLSNQIDLIEEKYVSGSGVSESVSGVRELAPHVKRLRDLERSKFIDFS